MLMDNLLPYMGRTHSTIHLLQLVDKIPILLQTIFLKLMEFECLLPQADTVVCYYHSLVNPFL